LTSDNSGYDASIAAQIVVASGSSDTIAASASLQLLLYTGTGSAIFDAADATSVTEIASQSTASSGGPSVQNLFEFGSGNNILIGNQQDNTFSLSSSAITASNVIWGGGGSSTYEIPDGVIEVAYAPGTLSDNEVFSLSSSFSSAQSSLGSLVTYIIDPSANDQLTLDGGTIAGTLLSASATSTDLELSTLSSFSAPPILFGEGTNSSGRLGLDITIGSSTIYAAGIDTAAALGTITGNSGVDLFELGSSATSINASLVDGDSSGGTLDLSGSATGYTPPSSIEIMSTNDGVGGSSFDLTIGGNTLTTSNFTTVIGGNGLHILDLSQEDSNAFGTNFTLTPDGTNEFIVTDSNGLDIHAIGFNTVVTAQGVDMVYSSVSDLTFLPTGTNTTIYGSSDGSDTLDVSGTNPDGGKLFNTNIEEWYVSPGNFPGRLIQDGTRDVNFTNITTVFAENGVSTMWLPLSYNPNEPLSETNQFSDYTITNGSDVSYIGIDVAQDQGQSIDVSGLTEIVSNDVGGQWHPVYVDGISEIIAEDVDSNPFVNADNLKAGQSSTGAYVGPGQNQKIGSGAVAYSSNITGGKQTVNTGGTTDGTQVGGVQIVEYDGTVTGTAVNSAGSEIVLSGGTASSTTVAGGGAVFADAGANVENVMVESGGYVIAFNGANLAGVTLQAGGKVISTGEVVSQYMSGFQAYSSATSGFIVGSGGAEYVLSGGSSYGDVLISATQSVYAGGNAVGAVISGGTQYVASGGSAGGATVYSAGTQIVSSGGSATDTVISSGGVEIVSSGGTASGGTVSSGGDLIVLPGASVENVNDSGGSVISSGVVIFAP